MPLGKYGDAMPKRAIAAPLALAALLAALVAGCGSETTTPSVPFAPSATLRAVGGTVRTQKPDFVLRVTTRPNDENMRSVAVRLPRVVLVDTTALGGMCSRSELKSKRCAGKRPLGRAEVQTPLARGGLAGPVYVVSGYGRVFHLAYVLSGPPKIVLEGRVVSKGGRIEAGVDEIPDQPVSELRLTIEGGPKGYLVLSRDICRSREPAEVTFKSQEGQVHREKVPLEAQCG
jgi:hypothetical protein